ncbi:MAG: LysM peptidoglycan-binding domain-containing protein [Actinomycetia bacterium]|nr:LysM peptidoglycan-binding domain-containing protein [Actinomycetes bacterium]
MNEFEDIDRELAATFAERPSVLSRPSLRDVKRRARRHQRQRSASVLGACAIVGVGGAAVLATRSSANQTTVGEGGGDTLTSIFCNDAVTTSRPIGVDDSVPPPTAPMTTTAYVGDVFFYTVQEGDNPTAVANSFGVTLAEMDAANVNTVDYGLFQVGLQLAIPVATDSTTTTNPQIGGTYTIEAGDYPGSVAEMFQVTVAELEAANRDVPGYGPFVVGAVINIPFPSQVPASTTPGVDTTGVGTTFPEPTAWTTTTVLNALQEVNCLPVAASTLPGDTTLTTFDLSTTTFVITKIGTVVQVGNCSNQEGVARYLTVQLTDEAFTMTAPDTCTIDLPVTKIIYNPDDPAALSVARSLAVFLANAVVEASGPEVPLLTTGTWAEGSGVVVLLGDDLAGKTLAEIAQGQTTLTTVAILQDTDVTVTTCFAWPEPLMTLPPPATSTTMPGSC